MAVHTLYKNLGETPLECMERFRQSRPELSRVAMTYAGRLDPLAEGLLLVLSGDEVHDKEKYLALPKTYECGVLWGVETDTGDVLGVVAGASSPLQGFETRVPDGLSGRSALAYPAATVSKPCSGESQPSQTFLEVALKEWRGKFVQKYPAYSSRPVNGKSLFQWAREGRLGEIEIPMHEVELLDAAFVSRRTTSGQELLSKILEKISLVGGDFRQQEIIAKWEEILSAPQQEYVIDIISLTVSSGFYVRQFVIDMAASLGMSALAFHIKRTRVGDFHI